MGLQMEINQLKNANRFIDNGQKISQSSFDLYFK